jgi:hypothetical protein
LTALQVLHPSAVVCALLLLPLLLLLLYCPLLSGHHPHPSLPPPSPRLLLQEG